MKKMLLGLGALACLASVGAGVALNRAVNNDAVETKAEEGDASSYVICGNIAATTGGTWWNEAFSGLKQGATDLAVKTNMVLAVGDTFAFIEKTGESEYDWSNKIGIDSLSSGSGSGCFWGNDGNLQCKVAGTYNVYLTSSKTISIDLVDTGADDEFVYVVTGNSTLTNLYLYNSEGSYTSWSDSKSLGIMGSYSFGGAGIHFTSGETDYDYYGIYRIHSGILGMGYTTMILKNDSQQSGDIQASGDYKVYFDGYGTSTDSDVYAAIDLIYKIGVARGSYEYEEVKHDDDATYDYSICAISGTDMATYVSSYSAINAGTSDLAKAILGSAEMNCYKLDGTTDMEMTALTEIIAVLNAHKTSGAAVVPMTFETSSSNALVISAIVVAMAAVCVGGFFVLRKQRQH